MAENSVLKVVPTEKTASTRLPLGDETGGERILKQWRSLLYAPLFAEPHRLPARILAWRFGLVGLIYLALTLSVRVLSNPLLSAAPSGLRLSFALISGPLCVPVMYFIEVVVCPMLLPGGDGLLWPALTMMMTVGEAWLIRSRVDVRLRTIFDIAALLVLATVFRVIAAMTVAVRASFQAGQEQPFALDRSFSNMPELVCHLGGVLSFVSVSLLLVPYVDVPPAWWAKPGRNVVRKVLAATVCTIASLAMAWRYRRLMPRPYIVFAPVIYSALEFGRAGGAISSFVTSVALAVIAEQQGDQGDVGQFLLLLVLTALVVGVVVDDSHSKERDLQATAATLETKVRALQLANEETEAQAQVKAQYLDDISHEIRTPLHGMLGYLSLLLASALTPAQKRWVVTMQGTAALLKSIVDDLLDISKVSTGRPMTVRLSTFTLSAALEEALTLTAGMKDLGAVELLSFIEPELTVVVLSDRQNLQRVVLNLLSNAIKFTIQGSVILSGRVIERREKEIEVEICVSDTGVGVRKEDIQKLFNRFSQVGRSGGPKAIKGTGLGLAISKELVETTMRGRIFVDSEYGQGSTFGFTANLQVETTRRLNFSQSPRKDPSDTLTASQVSLSHSPLSPLPSSGTPSSASGLGMSLARKLFSHLEAPRLLPGKLRGMVVHPQKKVADSLAGMFRAVGCQCSVQRTPDEAADAILSAAADRLAQSHSEDSAERSDSAAPLLLLVDASYGAPELMLFVMRIRVPVVGLCKLALLTASPESLDPILLPGNEVVDKILRKPLSFSAVAAVMTSMAFGPVDEVTVAPGVVENMASSQDTPTERLTGIRVLVVDDNSVNLHLAQEYMELMGISRSEITVAQNGELAVEAYEASKGQFDIILLDCYMPVLDGFSAARAIRHAEHAMKQKDGTIGGGQSLLTARTGITLGRNTPDTNPAGRVPETDSNSAGRGDSLMSSSQNCKIVRHVPIIALTADAVDATRERCLASGMNDILMKPFTERQLRECIVRWVFRELEDPSDLGDTEGRLYRTEEFGALPLNIPERRGPRAFSRSTTSVSGIGRKLSRSMDTHRLSSEGFYTPRSPGRMASAGKTLSAIETTSTGSSHSLFSTPPQSEVSSPHRVHRPLGMSSSPLATSARMSTGSGPDASLGSSEMVRLTATDPLGDTDESSASPPTPHAQSLPADSDVIIRASSRGSQRSSGSGSRSRAEQSSGSGAKLGRLSPPRHKNSELDGGSSDERSAPSNMNSTHSSGAIPSDGSPRTISLRHRRPAPEAGAAAGALRERLSRDMHARATREAGSSDRTSAEEGDGDDGSAGEVLTAESPDMGGSPSQPYASMAPSDRVSGLRSRRALSGSTADMGRAAGRAMAEQWALPGVPSDRAPAAGSARGSFVRSLEGGPVVARVTETRRLNKTQEYGPGRYDDAYEEMRDEADPLVFTAPLSGDDLGETYDSDVLLRAHAVVSPRHAVAFPHAGSSPSISAGSIPRSSSVVSVGATPRSSSVGSVDATPRSPPAAAGSTAVGDGAPPQAVQGGDSSTQLPELVCPPSPAAKSQPPSQPPAQPAEPLSVSTAVSSEAPLADVPPLAASSDVPPAAAAPGGNAALTSAAVEQASQAAGRLDEGVRWPAHIGGSSDGSYSGAPTPIPGGSAVGSGGSLGSAVGGESRPHSHLSNFSMSSPTTPSTESGDRKGSFSSAERRHMV